MTVTLLFNTPDLAIGGKSPKKSVDLKKKDYQDKTIKEVVSKYVIAGMITGQDESVQEQAIELIFNFIQPKDITDIASWWQQQFSSLVTKDSTEIILDLEFSAEGLAFMQQMM